MFSLAGKNYLNRGRIGGEGQGEHSSFLLAGVFSTENDRIDEL
jgi:hypothetical protein